jgi:ABC-type nickel/cobalt efflux system permease component RcnA
MRRAAVRLTAILCVAGALVVLPAVAAAAHPLGNFSVNRYHGLVVEPGRLRIDAVEDLAEIPTTQATPRIDGDRDGSLSETELAAWAPAACRQMAGELRVSADGRPVRVTMAAAKARTNPGQAGLPTLRVECGLVAALADQRAGSAIELSDRSPAQPGWHEITARGDRMTLESSNVPQSSRSGRLTSYPKDALASPLDQRQASLRVRPGGPPLAAEGDAAAEGVGRLLPRGADRLTQAFTALVARRALTPGFAALALAVALALGGLHALAPGHGKTIMAAYAASRGRRSLREVLALGLTVTVTHTAGVLVLGLLVGSGSRLAPAAAIPWLAVASGALVAVTGLTLLRRALRSARRRGAGDQGHAHHDRDHDHGHAHHDHGHGHGHPHHGHGHHHPHPGDERPRRGSVVLMGFAGGLVPSPSAVVVLVGAAALGQAWFGLALVLAYGAGLAASLTLVGVLVAGSGRWLGERLAARSGDGLGWRLASRLPRSVLPVGTASLVVVLGVGLALRGLPAALG